jgi:cytochrome c peroxidase
LQKDTVYRRLFKKSFGRPGTITEPKIYLAVQEFLTTAISDNSRFDSIRRNPGLATAAENDVFYNLFITEVGDCFHCHAYGNSFLMTDFTFRNDGLDSAATIADFRDPGRGGITGNSYDYGLFKVPSLRNVALSGPYMHDGRYKTLQQVINFYSDSLELSPTLDPFIEKHLDTLPNGQRLQHGGLHLDSLQKAEFIIFLNDFTDTSFLNNPNLKSPF